MCEINISDRIIELFKLFQYRNRKFILRRIRQKFFSPFPCHIGKFPRKSANSLFLCKVYNFVQLFNSFSVPHWTCALRIETGVWNIKFFKFFQYSFLLLDKIMQWSIHPSPSTASCPGFKYPLRRQQWFSCHRCIIVQCLPWFHAPYKEINQRSCHCVSCKFFVFTPYIASDTIIAVEKNRISGAAVEKRNIFIGLIFYGCQASLAGIPLP